MAGVASTQPSSEIGQEVGLRIGVGPRSEMLSNITLTVRKEGREAICDLLIELGFRVEEVVRPGWEPSSVVIEAMPDSPHPVMVVPEVQATDLGDRVGVVGPESGVQLPVLPTPLLDQV